MTGDHLETEQKYDADADFVLPGFDGLARCRRAGGRNYLHATYFDTEDLDLSGSRVTLRRRVGGADEGWHLKLPVRADTRQELHAPLGEGRRPCRRGWLSMSRTSPQAMRCIPSPSLIPNGPLTVAGTAGEPWRRSPTIA